MVRSRGNVVNCYSSANPKPRERTEFRLQGRKRLSLPTERKAGWLTKLVATKMLGVAPELAVNLKAI
jgi:hypothetical protein